MDLNNYKLLTLPKISVEGRCLHENTYTNVTLILCTLGYFIMNYLLTRRSSARSVLIPKYWYFPPKLSAPFYIARCYRLRHQSHLNDVLVYSLILATFWKQFGDQRYKVNLKKRAHELKSHVSYF